MRSSSVSNWDAIFAAILAHSWDRKPVIVFDEFQNIGRSNTAFPSIFLRIWEEQLKNQSVMVILCGSLIPLMESQMLFYTSPLYGRRTAQIRLRPIPFCCYSELFPDRSRKEQIDLYAITGGVPRYIETFSKSQDNYQNIYRAIEKSVLNRSSGAFQGLLRLNLAGQM